MKKLFLSLMITISTACAEATEEPCASSETGCEEQPASSEVPAEESSAGESPDVDVPSIEDFPPTPEDLELIDTLDPQAAICNGGGYRLGQPAFSCTCTDKDPGCSGTCSSCNGHSACVVSYPGGNTWTGNAAQPVEGGACNGSAPVYAGGCLRLVAIPVPPFLQWQNAWTQEGANCNTQSCQGRLGVMLRCMNGVYTEYTPCWGMCGT